MIFARDCASKSMRPDVFKILSTISLITHSHCNRCIAAFHAGSVNRPAGSMNQPLSPAATRPTELGTSGIEAAALTRTEQDERSVEFEPSNRLAGHYGSRSEHDRHYFPTGIPTQVVVPSVSLA